MKKRIDYRILMVGILSAVSVRMSAVIDFVSVDPLWEAAVMTVKRFPHVAAHGGFSYVRRTGKRRKKHE